MNCVIHLCDSVNYFFPVPCIQFEKTVYNVVEEDEADEEVEVCVITCSDIGESEIKAYVFGHENVSQIPFGAAIASKLPYCRNCTSRHVHVCTMYIYICMCRKEHVTNLFAVSLLSQLAYLTVSHTHPLARNKLPTCDKI